MGGAVRRRGGAWTALALVVMLGPVAAPTGIASGAASEPVDTGERFVHPATGAEFRVLRHALGGRKEIEGPDGTRHASIDAAVLAEDARLPDHRRLLDRSLWTAAEDPARAPEVVRVALLLRRQPVRDESLAARPRLRAEMGVRLGEFRRILARIAERREPDPERRMRAGERAEEEARLLTPFERAEVDRIRAEVLAASREARAAILAAARPIAEADHAEVAAAIGRIDGARLLGSSVALSTVTIEIPAGRLRTLGAELPMVARVLPSGTAELSTDTSVAGVGAGSWTGGGVDGSGVRVGILDSGIDGGHPALDGSVVAGMTFPEADSQGVPYGTDDAWFGHGTHVGGIVASRDSTYPGVAPGASLINARCFIGIAAFSYWIWRAGDYAVGEGADVLNCSFGSPGTTDGSNTDTVFFDAIAESLGVSVACATGNSSHVSQYNRAADGFNVLGVASYWDKETVDGSDDVISSSNPGPTSDGRRKPDLAAPGGGIASCAFDWEGDNADFIQKTGTSMATPHAAGALALLAAHGASWRPEGLRALLLANLRISSPVPSPHDSWWGWGALDLASAWTNRGSVIEGEFTDSGDDTVWLKGPSMAKGQRVFLCWNRDASYASGTYAMSYRAPVDLDLVVYDSATGQLLGESAKTLDSVEGVSLSADCSAPLIRVKRAGGFPSGQSSVDWALALDAASAPSVAEGPSVPGPPSLALSFDVPSLRIGDTTTVRAGIRNEGALALPPFHATLAVPAGVVFAGPGAGAENSSPMAVPALGPGDEAEVSWPVARLPGPGTLLTFQVRGDLEAFGESITTGWIEADLEADQAPWGQVLIENGAEVTRESPVALRIQVLYGDEPVTGMRVRRPGEEWGEPMAFSPDSLHALAPGVGQRTLEVRLRDATGRESVTLSDSIFLDAEPPTGLFVLSADAPYLMPWQALTADVSGDDGAGAGLETLQLRWIVDGAPGAWTPLPLDGSPSLPLDRPGTEDARAEVQLLDAAGNASALLADRIRLVDPASPSISSVKSLRAVLGPDGDVDAFRFEAFRDDSLDVRVRTKRRRGVADVPLAIDLYGPTGARIATGRYPEDGEATGIRGFGTQGGGRHWIVVRAAGPVPEGGVEYTLAIRVRHWRPSLTYAAWAYGGGPKEVRFRGVEGARLAGRIDLLTGPPVIRAPDGSTVPVGGGPLVGDTWKIAGTTLAGGDGEYVLVIPGSADVFYAVTVKPPRPRRLVAPDE